MQIIQRSSIFEKIITEKNFLNLKSTKLLRNRFLNDFLALSLEIFEFKLKKNFEIEFLNIFYTLQIDFYITFMQLVSILYILYRIHVKMQLKHEEFDGKCSQLLSLLKKIPVFMPL